MTCSAILSGLYAAILPDLQAYGLAVGSPILPWDMLVFHEEVVSPQSDEIQKIGELVSAAREVFAGADTAEGPGARSSGASRIPAGSDGPEQML